VSPKSAVVSSKGLVVNRRAGAGLRRRFFDDCKQAVDRRDLAVASYRAKSAVAM
jgi:hypothetical protein